MPSHQLRLALACLACASLSIAQENDLPAAITADDECLNDKSHCSLNALQLHVVPSADVNLTDLALDPSDPLAPETDNSTVDLGAGWYQGGDKVWGSGRGVESIQPGNVGYYNGGMHAAGARCGGPGCALIVNPPGHRTIDVFHIHTVHYAGYGSNLKSSLEGMCCGRGGWHGIGPCGGRAAFFPGFPGVFSAAMAGGDIHRASVIAWPGACGGRGTIVQLAFGCSIEHQIRGDYNPRLR
jgi:hypothetical protein